MFSTNQSPLNFRTDKQDASSTENSSKCFKLYLNSADSTSGTGDPADCVFTFDTQHDFPPSIHKIELQYFTVGNAIYNVTTANQALNWNSGSNETGNIPVGQYDTTTLAAAIKTVMDAAADGNTYTVTFSAVTQKFTVVASSNAFYFRFSVTPNIAQLLGFDQGVNTSSGTTLTSDNAADLSYPRELFLALPDYTNNILMNSYSSINNIAKTVVFYIPLSGSNGEVLFMTADQAQQVNVQQKQYNKRELTVKLVDRTGALMDLNGIGWTAVLQFYHK